MGDLVDEDLHEPRGDSTRRVPGWAYMLIGLGVGAAGAFLFLDRVDDPATPTTTAASSTSTTVPQPVALYTLPDDFEYGVELVVDAPLQGLSLVRVVEAGALAEEIQLPLGDLGVTSLPRFDALGVFLAMTAPMHDAPGSILVAGPVANLEVVATSVNGYAWHDQNLGDLAFTRVVDGQVQLWTQFQSGNNHQVAAPLEDRNVRVVAYGDWGFAVENETSGEVVVLDLGGDVVRAHRGVLQDSHPDGHLLLRREGTAALVDPAGTETEVLIGPTVDDALQVRDGIGDWWATAFAPDPGRYAFLGFRGLALVDQDGVHVVMANAQRPFLTVNDDYAMYPGEFGGMVVVDLDSGRDFTILDGTRPRAAAFSGGP